MLDFRPHLEVLGFCLRLKGLRLGMQAARFDSDLHLGGL